MTQISAKDVMTLRNRTGLPMMACKSALDEARGDLERAEEILRRQLKGKMDARTDRVAGEGRIAVAVNERAGVAAIVELRAETDFTARSEEFVSAADRLAAMALEAPAGDVAPGEAMRRIVDDLRMATGENCALARAHKMIGETGTTAYGTYVHHDGKLGVLVQAAGSISDETLRDVCMHIAAAHPTPLGITADDIPADVVEKERRFRTEQAQESGKPAEIASRMVEGAMRKFFSDVALLSQPFIRDESRTIGDVVGSTAQVLGFLRWRVGGQG
jgi:elongation factor Ts